MRGKRLLACVVRVIEHFPGAKPCRHGHALSIHSPPHAPHNGPTAPGVSPVRACVPSTTGQAYAHAEGLKGELVRQPLRVPPRGYRNSSSFNPERMQRERVWPTTTTTPIHLRLTTGMVNILTNFPNMEVLHY